MAYIGFNPSQLAIAPFATKYFTGDGVTTTFTLDQSVPGASESNVEVFVENVQQNPIDAYTIGGALNNQLIFSEAPVSGAAIYVIHKGEATYNLQPATGSVTAATLDPVLRNFTVDKFTGNGSTKTFTLSDTPYSPNSILVMVDGIVQTSGTNYNVSGNTLTFDVAPTEAPDNSSNITVVHLGFSSGNKAVMDASITPVKLSTGHPSWDTSSNLLLSSNIGLGATPTFALNSGWKVLQTNNGYVGNHTSNGIALGANNYVNSSGNYVYLTNGTATQYQQTLGSGQHFWRVATSGTADAQITWNQAMTLDVTGFLGLGNNSPSQLLTVGSSSVRGQIQVWGSTSASPTIALDHTNLGGKRWTLYSGGYATTNFDITDLTVGGLGRTFSLTQTGTVDIPYGQIKFPAAQNASSDPNTLDDYEEGTWTPVLTSGNGNMTGVTYQFISGRYVKIGNTVWYQCGFKVNGLTSAGTGEVVVAGLPFTVSNVGGWQEPVAACKFAYLTNSTTLTSSGGIMAFAYNSSNQLRFRVMNNADTALDAGQITNATGFGVTGFYTVA